MKGIEQGRAKRAYEFAQEGEQLGGGKKKNAKGNLEDSKEAKNFKSYVKKIPMMIKTNGLGATFAFIKSKKKAAYDLIYRQTYEWLQQSEITNHIFQSATSNDLDLVEVIISEGSWNYRTLTVEVLALFGWLRRFAEGLIEGESEED